MKKIFPTLWAAIGLFVASVVFFPFLNGMLVGKPPFLRAARGYRVEPEHPKKQEKKKDGGGNSGGHASVAPEEDTAPAGTYGPELLPAELAASQPPPQAAAAPVATTPESAAAPPGATPAVAVDQDAERLVHLVRVYEKMRPKQVALILGTLPEKQSVEILRRMKDRSAAQIMTALDPEFAARMSQLLVERGG